VLGDALDAADAAFPVGCESPSQFGRKYRRMFGAPPRQDVTALKPESRPLIGVGRLARSDYKNLARSCPTHRRGFRRVE
jgi:hypothetical protein